MHMTTTISRRTLLAACVAATLSISHPARANSSRIKVSTLNETGRIVTVEVPFNPARVAVIDAAVLDTLDHWNLTDRIVAMPQTTVIPYLAKYFKKSDAVINIGTLKEVDMEALMASEPDIIFISGRLAKKYRELSRIAPVVYMTTDRESGSFSSFEKNLMTLATIFGQEEKARTDIAGFTGRLEAIRQKASGQTALVGLVTSAHVNLLGNKARCSLISNEFGFQNIASKANANHGNESSFELLLKLNPDYFFVLDRDSAIARPGARVARDVLNNELVTRMKASRENRIIYLTPSAWYLAEGGVTAMNIMFTDIERALGLQ